MAAYIARQPIFDTEKQIFGYELLFRSGVENIFTGKDATNATTDVLSSSMLEFGLGTLTNGAKAFVNFTEKLLLNNTPNLLPNDLVVIEILEDVPPTPEIIAKCKEYKNAGYTVALDDYVDGPEFEPLFKIIDIIKVDFSISNRAERESFAKKFIPMGIKLLAEKVETQEDYIHAKANGYVYFQGYFFCKPLIISSKQLPGSKASYVRLMANIQKKDLNVTDLEKIIKTDVSLSFKLLKYINSSSFGLRNKISSIQHALTLLGVANVKKWATLIAMANVGSDKPSELLVNALIRARFCELLAKELNKKVNPNDMFLLGLLSLIDAMTDRPLKEMLNQMPLEDDLHNALLGKKCPMRDLFDIAIAYERADWKQLQDIQINLGCGETIIAQMYLEALKWVNEIEI